MWICSSRILPLALTFTVLMMVLGSPSARAGFLDDLLKKWNCADCTAKKEGSGKPTPEMPLVSAALCEGLKIGQSETISITESESPTTVEHSYRLTRAGENKYVAEVNVDFVPAAEYDGAAGRSDELDALFRQRVSQCLLAVKSVLKSPAGEELEIKLSAKGASDPPPQQIEIATLNHRSSSRKYESGIDCPTVIHEVLHLLGLCDEYAEKLRGYITDPVTGVTSLSDQKAEAARKAYDCRALGPADSVMSDQHAAFSSVFPRRKILFKTCDCPSSQECDAKALQIKTQMKGKPLSSCPEGFAQRTGYSEQVVLSDAALGDQKEWMSLPIKLKTNELMLDRPIDPLGASLEPPIRDSLLRPGQFRAIVAPGCPELNKKYYGCARAAYRTREVNGCPDMPTECAQGGEAWLR